MLRTISDPKVIEKFVSWMQENCVEPDSPGMVDIAEFGKDLSFNEAVGLAIQKFPTLVI